MQKKKFKDYLREYMMVLVLILVLIIFEILGQTMVGRNFFDISNLTTLISQKAYLVIVGVGITFIMLGGAMDLSTGYLLSTVGMVMALVDGNKSGDGTFFLLTFLVGIALAVVLSGFNGVMYSWLAVFPFIITLATQYIFQGATYLLTGGQNKTFSKLNPAFKGLGGTPISFLGNLKTGVIVMVIMVIIGSIILNKTHFGRNVYALGSNPDAVALSGVSVAKMRIAVFALAGLFFGIAQIINIGNKGGSVQQSFGVGDEFTVMAGAMLGGVKMGGGGGKISNMVVGVYLIGVLDYGMKYLNFNQYWIYVVLGIVLLAAIVLDTLQTRAAINAAKKVSGKPPKEAQAA
ncbi:MAG: ABC transporter permease [Parasporobacterium sp.]|nr:ABC transporter permease [Parasporobacterium sp.]